MIISASYKTDIPAFYGQWFVNRLRAGYCKMVNPYGRQIYRISLEKSDVEGFVFWTKNAAPIMKYLPLVASSEIPFVFQYTINNYPRALEQRLVDKQVSLRTFREISEKYGSRTTVWRYDTIIWSSLTPFSFHIENFRELANALRGFTDEVIISFLHLYRKTERNILLAARKRGFTWRDPSIDEKRALVSQLVPIAEQCGMQLAICAQPKLLVSGAEPAHCVDAQRLSSISGTSNSIPIAGNRPGCMCSKSRDIGEYDTCPHGCVYCYAVENHSSAKERFRLHDPASEFLFEPSKLDQIDDQNRQLPLFFDDA